MNDGVDARVVGAVGLVTLDRAEKLNALDWTMVKKIQQHFMAWEQDPKVTAVLIRSEGSKAFCAGGDIEATYAWTFGQQRMAEAYWRDEHLLLLLISTYRKPVVTLMHGYVLGGGVGLGCHASHRLATPDVRVGMPEVAIGLSPDVGGLYLLGRAPDQLGFYLGLAAEQADAQEALTCGLVDAVVRADAQKDLVAALADGMGVDQAVDLVRLPSDTHESDRESLAMKRSWIGECFSGSTVEGILENLESHPQDAARQTAKRIRKMAPVAVKVTLMGLQRVISRKPTLVEVLVEDLRRNVHFSHTADLREGIRAAVIDRDRQPKWSTASVESVPNDIVAGYFEPFDGRDLQVQTVLQRNAGHDRYKSSKITG